MASQWLHFIHMIWFLILTPSLLRYLQYVIPVAELHGFGGCSALVEQRGVGHGHACDLTDHSLVIEERLQATLRDLGLVRRVLSHPEKCNKQRFSRASWDNSTKYSGNRGRTLECIVQLLQTQTWDLWANVGNSLWFECEREKQQRSTSSYLTWVNNLQSQEDHLGCKLVTKLCESTSLLRGDIRTSLTSLRSPGDCAGWAAAPSSCSSPCRCRNATLCSLTQSSAENPELRSHLQNISRKTTELLIVCQH